MREPKTTMSNSDLSKKWVFNTGGFPQCLRQTTYTPPSPSSLKPTEIQIRTKAFAINPVDVQSMNLYNKLSLSSSSSSSSSSWSWSPLSLFTAGTGNQNNSSSSSSSPPAGRETCEDFSGTVIHAGADAGFQPGDEVFGFSMVLANGLGTAGEVLTLNTADPSVAVVRKPAGWDHVHAASLPLVWLTAKVTIESVRAQVEVTTAAAEGQGERNDSRWLVVLGGSSSTGIYTIRLAKARGWKVLATCSSRNVEFVRDRLGADEVVDYTAVPSIPAEIYQRLTPSIEKGDGVVIADCVGGTECLYDKDLGGKITRFVTIVGDKTDRTSMGGPAIYSYYPKMVMRWFLGQVGLGVHYDCVVLKVRKDWLEEAAEMLKEDELIVDSTFKFDELPKALEKMVGGKVRGKLVGVMDSS